MLKTPKRFGASYDRRGQLAALAEALNAHGHYVAGMAYAYHVAAVKLDAGTRGEAYRYTLAARALARTAAIYEAAALNPREYPRHHLLRGQTRQTFAGA